MKMEKADIFRPGINPKLKGYRDGVYNLMRGLDVPTQDTAFFVLDTCELDYILAGKIMGYCQDEILMRKNRAVDVFTEIGLDEEKIMNREQENEAYLEGYICGMRWLLSGKMISKEDVAVLLMIASGMLYRDAAKVTGDDSIETTYKRYSRAVELLNKTLSLRRIRKRDVIQMPQLPSRPKHILAQQI